MKTKKELKKMSNQISVAIRKFHRAVFDNLKESGKEFSVKGDDDEEKGLSIRIIGRYGDAVPIIIDKVRWNEKSLSVSVHICEEDYTDADYWVHPSILGDDEGYVYDCIEWDC